MSNDVISALLIASEENNSGLGALGQAYKSCIGNPSFEESYSTMLHTLMVKALDQREERFLEYPRDAEGNLVRIGDMLSEVGEVVGISTDNKIFAGESFTVKQKDGSELVTHAFWLSDLHTKRNPNLTEALRKLLIDARGYESIDDASLIQDHIQAIEDACHVVG